MLVVFKMTRIILVIYLQVTCFYLKAFPEVNENQYIGCFQSFENPASNVTQVNMTIDSCLQSCGSSIFAGLEAGVRCICGDDVRESLPENNCLKKCPGNKSQLCGGETGPGISVYTVCDIGYYGSGCNQVCHCASQVPCNRTSGKCPARCETGWKEPKCDIADVSNTTLDRYIGCFKDTNNMSLPQKHSEYSTNSIENCFKICAKLNNTYIGLQYGYDCNCGEIYDKYGGSDACGKPIERNTFICPGNPSQICGGNYANSVYSVCPKGSFGKDCVRKCHCHNDTRCTYVNGSCPKGCETGWTGSSCNIRVANCNETNGGCDVEFEVCEYVDLKYAKIVRCSCKEGYNRKKQGEHCTDIDECSDLVRSCGNSSKVYNCTNTVGSFICHKCSEGYENINGTCMLPPRETPDPVPGSTIGAIVGITIAAIILILMIIGIVIILRRKKGDTSDDKSEVNFVHSNKNEDSVINHKERRTYETNYDDGESQYANVESNVTALKVADFVRLVETLETTTYKKEFQSVPMSSGVTNYGKKKELKKKNRFQNIIPYDNNRVVLPLEDKQHFSDYINASVIMGFKSSPSVIATQGPTYESLSDFWRMVFETRVGVIVMITNLEENGKKKCENYWSGSGKQATFGNTTVSMSDEKIWPDYTRRTIKAERNSKTIEVVQWHYTSWPDHGIPSDARSFLTFRRQVSKSSSAERRTLVHCSAGAGRTGSFIAIDYLLEEAKNSGYVDVLSCLKHLRKQRTQMIQNLEQYTFVHTALADQLRTGDTLLPCGSFQNQFNELHAKRNANGKTKLDLQYDILCRQKSESKGSAVNLPNRKHNDFEAVYVQSLRQKNYYVVAHAQSSDGFEDLWELCNECGSTLVVFIDDSQKRASFLPSSDRQLTTDSSILTLNSSTEEDGVAINKLSIQKKMESVYANATDISAQSEITLIHALAASSPERDSVDFTSIKSVHGIIKRLAQKNDTSNGPIIIISRNDERLSGFCVAAFNAFDMIIEENEVDLYQIVHDIKKSNTRFIPTAAAYEELHNVVGQYVKTKESTARYAHR